MKLGRTINQAAGLTIDRLCDEFDAQWAKGIRPNLRQWLDKVAEDEQAELFSLLLPIEIEFRLKFGETLERLDLESEFVQFREVVVQVLAEYESEVGTTVDGARPSPAKIMSRENVEKDISRAHLRVAEPRSEATHIGNYFLISQLGHGAMGAVYLAGHQRFPKRRYAIKVLYGTRINQELIARFDREVAAQGALQHVNVVTAIDAGLDRTTPYLVMEYVVGQDLTQVIEQHQRLAIDVACEIIRQAATGLHYLHQQGIIHRDIKPSNLLLDTEGTVKVIDLGLATLQHAAGELTSPGTTLGTYAYMAPEQFSDARSAAPTSDIYSLGCTLYCLLAGRPPFCRDGVLSVPELMKCHLNEEPKSLSAIRQDIPLALANLVAACLNKSPCGRPASAADLARQLAIFSKGVSLRRLVVIPRERERSSPERIEIKQPEMITDSEWKWSRNERPSLFNVRVFLISVCLLLSASSISLVLSYFGPYTTEAWQTRFDRLGVPTRFPIGTGFLIEWIRAVIFVGLTCFVMASRFGRHCHTFFFGRNDSVRLWASRLLVMAFLMFFLFAEGQRQLTLAGAPQGLVEWAKSRGIETTATAEAWPYSCYFTYSIIIYSVVFCGLMACPILGFLFSDGPYLRERISLFCHRQAATMATEPALANLRRFAAECRQLTAPYIEAMATLAVGVHFEFWIGRWTLTDAGLQTAILAWVVLGLSFGFVIYIGKIYGESFLATQRQISRSGTTADEFQLSGLNVFWFLKTTFLYNISGLVCLSLGLVVLAAILTT